MWNVKILMYRDDFGDWTHNTIDVRHENVRCTGMEGEPIACP